MFGRFGVGRAMQMYRDGKQAAATLPSRDVTEAEFLAAWAAVPSLPPADGPKQAKLSKALGGHTQVGGEMLRVVEGD